jgi:hypothetical protein
MNNLSAFFIVSDTALVLGTYLGRAWDVACTTLQAIPFHELRNLEIDEHSVGLFLCLYVPGAKKF